MNNKYNNKSTH